MSINKYIEQIDKVAENQASGKYLFCPCSIPIFNRDFSGIGKSSITIVTAGTSQGKSSFYKNIMFDAIKNAIKYNIKIKFILFLLEENEERFVHSIISYLLYQRYNLRFNTVEFSGRKVNDKGEQTIVPKDIRDKIKSLNTEVEQYLSFMKIYTNINQPESIYKEVKKYARTKIQYYNNDVKLTIEDIEKEKAYTHCIEDEEIIVPCVDHISLISSQGKGLYDAIDELCQYSKFYMEKILKCHVFLIQQNSKANGTVESIKNELFFASLTNLSDNKSSSNSAYDVISVTIPAMYDIKKWRKYDIEKLKSGLAVVFLIKARYGKVGYKIPIFFDGKVNHYELLPSTKDPDFETKMEEYYERVENFYK